MVGKMGGLVLETETTICLGHVLVKRSKETFVFILCRRQYCSKHDEKSSGLGCPAGKHFL